MIGVLKTKTQVANYNTPDNDCVFIPFETASLYRDLKYPDDIVWMPANPVFREQTVKQVRQTLARLHNFSAARRARRDASSSSTSPCGWWTPWGSPCGCCWASSAA